METKQLAVSRRFFKIMMPGFHHKLKLPPVICKELQNNKTQTAILHSRKGEWKINMCRNCNEDEDEDEDEDDDDDDDDDGLICFKQGWPQFVDRHALSIGDFLVFEHTGKLHFNVSVFASSACEKEFRVEPKKEKEETSAATTGHPRKRARDDESPYFEKKMIPFHATKNARVNIPVEFARSNNLEQKTSTVLLRDSDGRKWPVKLHLERSNGILRMCNGWHDFYTSNSIKDGDVCVFKLKRCLQSHTNKLHFNVSVFHLSAFEKEKEKEETSAATTGHPRKRARDDESPYFVKKMLPYHATKQAEVNIPAVFVRSNNLEQKRSVILRDSGGKKWPVKLWVERSKYGVGVYLRMCTGWHDFYEAKSLKDGDICVFKLKLRLQTHTNIIFDVQINPA